MFGNVLSPCKLMREKVGYFCTFCTHGNFQGRKTASNAFLYAVTAQLYPCIHEVPFLLVGHNYGTTLVWNKDGNKVLPKYFSWFGSKTYKKRNMFRHLLLCPVITASVHFNNWFIYLHLHKGLVSGTNTIAFIANMKSQTS